MLGAACAVSVRPSQQHETAKAHPCVSAVSNFGQKAALARGAAAQETALQRNASSTLSAPRLVLSRPLGSLVGCERLSEGRKAFSAVCLGLAACLSPDRLRRAFRVAAVGPGCSHGPAGPGQDSAVPVWRGADQAAGLRGLGLCSAVPLCHPARGRNMVSDSTPARSKRGPFSAAAASRPCCLLFACSQPVPIAFSSIHYLSP